MATILFKHLGENSTTPRSPIAEVMAVVGDICQARVGDKTFTVDLTGKVTLCLSFGNDMPVSEHLYEIGEVELPSWLAVEDWVNNLIKWKWLWGLDSEVREDFYECWQRGLLKISGTEERLAAIRLLKTKSFRSDFRRSLCEQLICWFMEEGEGQHRSPFSPRQWDCLIKGDISRKARLLDNKLYSAAGARFWLNGQTL